MMSGRGGTYFAPPKGSGRAFILAIQHSQITVTAVRTGTAGGASRSRWALVGYWEFFLS